MGHSSIRVTLDLYGHLFPDANRGVLESLDALTAHPHPIAGMLRRPRRKEKSPQAGTFETGATGLEPATSGVTGRRSNQLNYAPVGAAL